MTIVYRGMKYRWLASGIGQRSGFALAEHCEPRLFGFVRYWLPCSEIRMHALE